MRRLFVVVVVAVMATLAFASVAAAKGGGAVTIRCSTFGEQYTGTVVFTPSGNYNTNCGYPGPSAGGGAVKGSCSSFFGVEGYSGNIIITPSGHFKFHCDSGGGF